MSATETLIKPSESPDGWAHLKQSRNSKRIRFVLWLYDLDPKHHDLNTCKLLWAYAAAPLMLLLRLVLWIAEPLANRVEARQKQKRAERREEAKLQPVEIGERKKSRMERALNKLADTVSAFWAKHGGWISKGVKGLAIVFGALYLIFALIVVVLAIIEDPIILPLSIAGLVIVGGLFLLFSKTPVGRGVISFIGMIAKLGRSFHRHTCAKIDLTD